MPNLLDPRIDDPIGGAWSATLRRSVRLFNDFRVEQTDPARFYTALAADSVGQLAHYTAGSHVTHGRSRQARPPGGSVLQDTVLLDVGGDGMVGLAGKFPFDTQRHDYEYWDGTLGTTVIATYVDDAEIKGVTTYQYEVNASSDDAVLSAGGDKEIGTDDDVRGTYEANQTIYVEPTTGSYIDQSATQKMVAGETTLIDAEMSYTDKTVATNAEDAKANLKQLNLIGTWIPVGGLIAGLVFLLIGLWLVLSGRKPNGGSHAAADDRTLVDA